MAPDSARYARFSENKKVIGTGQQNYSNFNAATNDALELFVAGV